MRSLASLALCGLFLSATAHAADKVCKLEIAGNDMMQFDKKALAVAADCTHVELTLKHTGKIPVQAMGHNWVLVKAADLDAVNAAGLKAGAAQNYVPAGDKRVLASTKMIGGGQSTSVKFATAALKKGEAYAFFCSFPGHSTMMKGTFRFG